MMIHLVSVSFLLALCIGEFNQPLDVVIGERSPPFGGVILQGDSQNLNLASDCGPIACPSVVIFGGKQWGTISIRNCKIGRQYLIINRSHVDLGIVLQQDGGRFGSKAISRFDAATCFCSDFPRSPELVESPDLEPVPEPLTGTGVLLCR